MQPDLKVLSQFYVIHTVHVLIITTLTNKYLVQYNL